jgi:hypothetical protein
VGSSNRDGDRGVGGGCAYLWIVAACQERSRGEEKLDLEPMGEEFLPINRSRGCGLPAV